MAISKERAVEIRELLSKGVDRATYVALRREFIAMNEQGDCKGHQACYPDPHGYVTVGIGFNMDRDGARAEWKAAFADEKNPPDFDAVKSRRAKLTQEQINTLYDHAIDVREKELKAIYSEETWKKLKQNERLAIEDLYYNGPKLVNGNTHFHQNIRQYTDTGDAKHLNAALWEVSKNSNSAKRKGHSDARGIQNRRDVEAIILNTHGVDIEKIEAPDYKKGNKRADSGLAAPVLSELAAIGESLRGVLSGGGQALASNAALPALKRGGEQNEIS